MPRTFLTQDEYDLLLEFAEWWRKELDEHEEGFFDADSSDEIVQAFITETDDSEA